MTATVLDVLAEFAITSTEAQVAAELAALLDGAAPRRAADLAAAEQAFLAEFGGVPAASARQLAALDARSTARAALEVADSRSRTEVAELLGISQSRVSHRLRAGELYAFAGAGDRRRYPGWQFVAGRAVPHLDAVLPALPRAAHPVAVRGFMTAPQDALRLDGRAASPVEWLVAGGDPAPVAELAATLGEQV